MQWKSSLSISKLQTSLLFDEFEALHHLFLALLWCGTNSAILQPNLGHEGAWATIQTKINTYSSKLRHALREPAALPVQEAACGEPENNVVGACTLAFGAWFWFLSKLCFLFIVGVRPVLLALPVFFVLCSMSCSSVRFSLPFSSVLLGWRKMSYDTSDSMRLCSGATALVSLQNVVWHVWLYVLVHWSKILLFEKVVRQSWNDVLVYRDSIFYWKCRTTRLTS